MCVNIHTHTHTHTPPPEYYSPQKTNEKMSFAASWMDLEIVILSEVNQTEKDKYHMISLTHVIKKKMTQRNLFTEQK